MNRAIPISSSRGPRPPRWSCSRPRSRPPTTTVPTSSGQAGPRVGPSSLYPDPTLPYAVGALTSDGPVSAASISSKERPLVSKPMNQ